MNAWQDGPRKESNFSRAAGAICWGAGSGFLHVVGKSFRLCLSSHVFFTPNGSDQQKVFDLRQLSEVTGVRGDKVLCGFLITSLRIVPSSNGKLGSINTSLSNANACKKALYSSGAIPNQGKSQST